MEILLFILFMGIGVVYYLISFIQLLLTFTCSIPMIRLLKSSMSLLDNYIQKSIKRTIIVNIIIAIIVLIPIFMFASSLMIYGFIFGFALALLLSIRKLGMTHTNTSEFINNNYNHIDVEQFQYILKLVDKSSDKI